MSTWLESILLCGLVKSIKSRRYRDEVGRKVDNAMQSKQSSSVQPTMIANPIISLSLTGKAVNSGIKLSNSTLVTYSR